MATNFVPQAYGAVVPTWGIAIGGKDSNGNFQPLLFDATGKLIVSGSFSATTVQSTTDSSAGPTTVGTSPVTLLAANNSRLKFLLQNVGTTKIWVLFGAGTPSSSLYHIALPAGGTANDGSCPIYIDTMWVGLIQAISSGAGGSCSAVEFTA